MLLDQNLWRSSCRGEMGTVRSGRCEIEEIIKDVAPLEDTE